MTFEFKETCPKRGYWCSFRLVDEHGEATPYAGLNYVLHDRMGMSYSGTLDSEGFGYLKNFYCGPLILDLSMPYQGAVDPWYDELQIRKHFKLPLTALQVAAEQSPTGPRDNGRTYLARQRAEQEKAVFLQVEVRDFARPDEAAHLPEPDTTLTARPWPYLKEACTHANTCAGIALMVSKHHVLEVKALRALSPMFSGDKAFCALNAYHLSMMAVLSYAPFHKARAADEAPTPPPYTTPGCIANVLHSQLGHLVRPTQFKESGPFHLLCEEVPYSKRLEIVPYDPQRYAKEAREQWDHPEHVHFLHHQDTETQAFITHNDRYVLISVRGSQELADFVRDMDARQVPHVDGKGKIHRGFHDAFLAARRFVEAYMDAFYTGSQTILVCGHSLGGAIALLLAEWLNREYSDDLQLYTYGAPRTGDSTFIQAAQAIVHHRLVNHNDPIPSVPAPWMDAEWKMAVPGSTLLIAAIGNPVFAAVLLLAGLINLRGNPYQHHGEQRHFMPRKAGLSPASSVLWQPGCAAVEELTCARFASEIELKGDMPERDSMVKQLLSMAEHFNDPGYANASLATLLRWYNSVAQHQGALFTTKEREQLGLQIEDIQVEVERPVELSYAQFRHNLRRRAHPRLERLTELQLRTLFHDDRTRLDAVRTEQRKALNRTQKRLKAQGQRTLAWQDVFGDLPDTVALRQLLHDWLALETNQAAARLAKVPATRAGQQYA
ncbi:lipase family protein [Pseudomonas alkylphenolica]|uniref:lipase family protein n=1 Tax=Pseudomonas alkylphenolica TaxID=237609 RepID=UPI0018D9CD9B|nr:lipase family protein [Pseudomonas alkylphenolica]MBH3428110.1 lipase family protein [Pseudomonas alkylphenolica]